MADDIFVPAARIAIYNGMNYWECSICGVRKPNPVLHAQWHADLAAYMKSTNATYTTTQPTISARLGLNLNLATLLATLAGLPI